MYFSYKWKDKEKKKKEAYSDSTTSCIIYGHELVQMTSQSMLCTHSYMYIHKYNAYLFTPK
jgi:hypothetical protein